MTQRSPLVRFGACRPLPSGQGLKTNSQSFFESTGGILPI
jgi:hypothetical protein